MSFYDQLLELSAREATEAVAQAITHWNIWFERMTTRECMDRHGAVWAAEWRLRKLGNPARGQA